MLRFKHQAKKYALLFASFFVFFLFMWFYFSYSFLDMGDIIFKFSEEDILRNLFTHNYHGYIFYSLLLPLPFAFALNYLLDAEKTVTLVRLKSRSHYIKVSMLHILLCSFLLAFFHEAVDALCLAVFFDIDLIKQLNIPFFACINFFTVFLFYIRAGIIFLLLRIYTPKKLAPFLLALVYFVEFYVLAGYLPWLPFNDVTMIDDFVNGGAPASSVVPLLIRGVGMTVMVFAAAYFVFQKKDVLNNEK